MALGAKYKSVSQAAAEIGITSGRLRQMIRCGECRANKVETPILSGGHYWEVPIAEIARIKSLPQATGRPRISSAS